MLLLNRGLSGSIVQKNLETAKIYLILSTSKHGYVQWGRSQFFDFTSSRRIRNFSTSILPSNWERCKSRNSRKFGMLQTACDSIENPLIIFRQFKCVGSFHLKWILVTTSTLTATQEKRFCVHVHVPSFIILKYLLTSWRRPEEVTIQTSL